jgi:molecular chaperone GrpE
MIQREELSNGIDPLAIENTAQTEDVEVLKRLLSDTKEKMESNLVNWQRTQADFINYKRRIELERGETIKYANTQLILNLLPILDDLERALNYVPAKVAKLKWTEGIKLIERKIRSSLEAQGLTPVKAKGEIFNPNMHEAARHDMGKENIVIEELQKGYKLHDRVIRPAMVVVGNGMIEKQDQGGME